MIYWLYPVGPQQLIHMIARVATGPSLMSDHANMTKVVIALATTYRRTSAASISPLALTHLLISPQNPRLNDCG